jgi:preprotein translocase subunit YajC
MLAKLIKKLGNKRIIMKYTILAIFTSFAAQAQDASAQQPNPLVSFAPFVLIFVIFYFLMIRPQKKKLEEEQKMLKSLSKGDEIYTKSGILGKITGMTEKVVTLEISEGVKLKIVRSQIAGLADSLFNNKEEAKS